MSHCLWGQLARIRPYFSGTFPSQSAGLGVRRNGGRSLIYLASPVACTLAVPREQDGQERILHHHHSDH